MYNWTRTKRVSRSPGRWDYKEAMHPTHWFTPANILSNSSQAVFTERVKELSKVGLLNSYVKELQKYGEGWSLASESYLSMALFRDKTNIKHSQDLLILYLQTGSILLCFLKHCPKIRGSFDTCFQNSRDHLYLFQISFLASSSLLLENHPPTPTFYFLSLSGC